MVARVMLSCIPSRSGSRLVETQDGRYDARTPKRLPSISLDRSADGQDSEDKDDDSPAIKDPVLKGREQSAGMIAADLQMPHIKIEAFR